ncbi:MAG: tetratricopeptide repeat protein [Vicinamibacteria bacterium]|jgi:predicted O-linked N-acetylglucosamine transferase (SPINDLY family)
MTPSEILEQARTLHRAGAPEAEQRYRDALERDPGLHAAWDGIGMIAHAARRWPAAIDALQRAVALAPRNPAYRVHLGAALNGAGRAGEAMRALEAAIEIDPRSTAAWVNLGNACQRAGDADRAIEALERALTLDPMRAAAHNNLGNLLKETGRVDEAITAYDRAIAADPGLATAASNRLAALKLVADRTPSDILAAHRAWAKRVERDVPPRAAVRAMDTPDRPLRIGYLSPDAHIALPAFIRRVFATHDPEAFKVHAYFNNPQRPGKDPASEARVARRVLAGLDNARVAALIASDDLDLLVDLAGHTGHNRLPVFARRPARVALTWLDYVSTTGMATIDYRVTDAVADPPDAAETGHSERLLRLPVPAWCWTPPALAQEPGPPPLARVGVPTFGSFNNAMKLTDATLALWKPLFASLPTARLVAVGVPTGSARKRVVDALGLAPPRVEFVPRLDDAGYRAMYERVDVALDPTPFSGATTTLDALWQGVPVVTLPGAWTWSRSSASLLTGLDARNWIARDADHFVAIARGLVGDATRLAEARAGLRTRMLGSPMIDVPMFVRHLEGAYREAWGAFARGELHRDDAMRMLE